MTYTKSFAEIDTPSLLVDRKILEANLSRVADLARKHGIGLRPHAKTHKCIEIGRKQIESGALGLTLAKTSEAMVFAEQGIADIFLAYPVVGAAKINRLVQLADKCRISAGVDSEICAVELNKAFQGQSKKLPVLLEVDTGLGRTGVAMEEMLQLASRIHQMSNLQLKGIYTYRGALLSDIAPSASTEELKEIITHQGYREAATMGELAQRMREAGLPVEVVSAGSTPTAASVVTVPGLTEIRPGTYVFNDAMQVRMNACSWQDCAAKVLVTVISRPSPDRAIIDGGCKAFAGDAKPDSPPLNLNGYGTVIDNAGTPCRDIQFERMNEEHGILKLTGLAATNLKVGARLLIVPNHICTTVNLFDNLTIVSDIDGNVTTLSIEDSWPVAARGRVQ